DPGGAGLRISERDVGERSTDVDGDGSGLHGDGIVGENAKSMDTRRRNGLLLALVALGCLGGAALFGADLVEQSRSRLWPSVPGVIDQSGIKYSCGGRGGGAYAPDVEYSYAVNGRQFRGHRRRVYDRTCASREWAREFATREYPVGKAHGSS